MGSGAEIELVHRFVERFAAFRIEATDLAHQFRRHGTVAGDSGDGLKTFELNLAAADDALANRVGGFARFFVGQLLVIDHGNFYVEVDPVQERAGDALAIVFDIGGGAGAFALGIAEVAAFA